MTDLFTSRRSVRRYLDKEIPKDVLSKLLEAARWAPSAHNSQPWKFVVFRNEKDRLRLAKIMADAWMKDLLASGTDRKEAEKLVNRSIIRYSKSPVIVLVCLDKAALRSLSKEEYLLGIQSVAAAIENLLLAAHKEGLGACWTCAPLYCPKEIVKALNLPEEWEPQAAITIGYPSGSVKPKERKSMGEMVYEYHGGLRPW